MVSPTAFPKFNTKQRAEIRKRYRDTTISQRALAVDLCISLNTLKKILNKGYPDDV